MKPETISPLLAPSLLVLVLGLGACASTPGSSGPSDPDEAPTPPAQPIAARAGIQVLEYEVEIAAPVEEVSQTMLSDAGYRKWTAPFLAGSYFEGTWAEGERMRFLAPGGSGMVAEIAVHRPHELVSIRHVGFVFNGVEDTTSEAVKTWAPAYENYHFRSVPGGTVVSVEHEVLDAYVGSMDQVWPKALAALKALCEGEG